MPPSAFNRDLSKPDGRYPRCKLCRSGPAAILKVARYRTCQQCHRLFVPRHNKGRYVEHCSRACMARSRVGPQNHTWRGVDIVYTTAHARVYSARGRPTRCGRCGIGGRLHWALDHERCSVPLRPEFRPYSADPMDYIPLCVPCHKTMDLARHEQQGADHAT